MKVARSYVVIRDYDVATIIQRERVKRQGGEVGFRVRHPIIWVSRHVLYAPVLPPEPDGYRLPVDTVARGNGILGFAVFIPVPHDVRRGYEKDGAHRVAVFPNQEGRGVDDARVDEHS